MPLFLISLFKGKSLRVLIVALMAFSVTVGGWVVYNKIWDDGYSTAQQRYEHEILLATQAAVEQARLEWEASAEAARTLLKKEVETKKEIDDVITKIPEAVANSECDHIGADALRLFNEAIGEGGTQNAPSTGSVDPRVP